EPWILPWLHRELERVLVLIRRNVLPADLPNARNRLWAAIRFLDILQHPKDAPLKKTPENLHSGEAIKGNLHSEAAPGGPKIICLCGSSRFVDTMAVMAWNFEKEGAIAMGLHLLPHWYTDKAHHQGEHEGVAERMDELHLRKIDLSDEVFVVNVGGYYGDSTAREIEYARDHGKPVRFLEDKITREPPAEVEDAPGGPTGIKRLRDACERWLAGTKCSHPAIIGDDGFEKCVVEYCGRCAVRDALNGVDRLKGETDG
ncbi:hypothetical protein LCGC14_2151170, partial [marine sediment metagenome]